MVGRKISDADWARLRAAARAAARKAYAPYSRLRVGAALLGRRGETYVGCNTENASLGLTVCAERAAVFGAVAAGERGFRALVIYSPDASAPLAPCGACRQVLAEFCEDLPIVSLAPRGQERRFSLCELLPDRFGAGEENRRCGGK
jgi:cytidine deaminase